MFKLMPQLPFFLVRKSVHLLRFSNNHKLRLKQKH